MQSLATMSLSPGLVGRVQCRSSRPSLPLRPPQSSRGPSRRQIVCRAQFQDDMQDTWRAVCRRCDLVSQRYDFVSTCTGALCVTTYCVSKGQSPVLALTITAVATISALIFNELWSERAGQS